jgi:hypothetical protein
VEGEIFAHRCAPVKKRGCPLDPNVMHSTKRVPFKEEAGRNSVLRASGLVAAVG